MNDLSQMKSLLLQAPEGQIDKTLVEVINRWTDDKAPTSLDVLEALDHAVRYASASQFVVMVLEEVLKRTIANECTTYEEFVKNATFLSEDEMVEHLLKHLPEDCKQTIREMKQPELIYLTRDIVDSIENYYWLWDKRNPFTDVSSPAKHPTNVAFHVLAIVHERLNEEKSNDNKTA